MSVPDMDVIKDIPGYKVILKAVLKCQIQQLVEQLAATTEEESVLLTASVSDGTLSHLGSDSGKNFLEDHEDIKSQFLGFCLKRHHMRKQEKERQAAERLAEQSRMAAMPPQYSPRAGFTQRSPRFPSPRQQGPHPVALLRAGSPGGGPIRGGSGMRHAPYPMQRLPRRPNFDGQGQVQGRGQGPGIRPLMSSGQVIKIEPDENDDTSNDAAAPNSSQPSSPSQSKPPSGQNVKQESDKDDDARSESSSSTIPNEAADMKFSDSGPPEGLSLDSDLSNLISDSDANQSGLAKPQNPDGDTSQPGQSSSELDTNVKVKLEAVGDSEMDLEITGVELGGVSGPLGGASPWSQIGGAMGSQSDLEGGDQGYNYFSLAMDLTKPGGRRSNQMNSSRLHSSPVNNSLSMTGQRLQAAASTSGGIVLDPTFIQFMGMETTETVAGTFCDICNKDFQNNWAYKRHRRIVREKDKPYACEFCNKQFSTKSNMKNHLVVHLSKDQFQPF